MKHGAGDVREFSELVAASRSRVYGYIYAMVHNKADADDIYQQTTLLMWEKFGDFEIGTSFGSWGLQIAHNNIRNFQRSHTRKHLLFFSEPVMEKLAGSYQSMAEKESEERLEVLLRCIKEIPERNQRILRLRYGENVSVCELAKREGKAEANVYQILSRLRKALFECIQTRLAVD